jgi:hypothetical protein
MLQGASAAPPGLTYAAATAAPCPPTADFLVHEPHEPHERTLVGQARDPES